MLGNLSLNKNNFFDFTNRIILNSKLSHAYLIEVGDYDLDFKFVLYFVKMIVSNCKYEEVVSDDNISIMIDNNSYPDLMIIEPDGQWIKKGQLLKLQEEFNNKSLLGNKRIYIIKQCEKLNSSSANTILKFLEEPNDDVIAILLTNNRYHVIDTILSRCQILNMKDDFNIESVCDETKEFLKFLLKEKELFIRYNYIFNNLLENKEKTRIILSEIQFLLLYYINKKDEFVKNFDSKYHNVEKFIKYCSIIEEEVSKLDFNVNYKLWLDCLFAELIGG